MRLDKYLKVSRLIKRRTVANEVADAGRILINGKIAKASQAVKEGDIIEVTFGNRPIKVKVLSDVEPRTKDVARERCMAEQAGNSDLILENREKLTVTGVRRVLQCNAESAAIETARGVLQLAGAQLNVTSLDLDSGEVKLTGRIDTVEYTAARTPGGFLSRLLR